jgi:hypothetical protein
MSFLFLAPSLGADCNGTSNQPRHCKASIFESFARGNALQRSDLYPVKCKHLLPKISIHDEAESAGSESNYFSAANSHQSSRSPTASPPARASCEGDTVMPRAFAVLRLIANSSLIGNSTGKLAGLAPLRILSKPQR